ncbi:MAG: hypothetical protein RLZZ344_710 [Pseudomonadota bacterium]|jgi:pimeloyl-ACP methyl ester carboxylesterase
MKIRDTYAYTGGRPFDPQRPCMVFIHGAANDHSVWGLQARFFAHRGFGVLALDLPCHGKSLGTPLPSVEAAGRWLLALLTDAGVSKATLVGHSMGSLIALEAAAQSQEGTVGPAPIIDHLIMVGTTYPMAVSPQLLSLAQTDPLEAVENVAAWSIYSLGPKPGAPGPGTWLYGASRALMRRMIHGAPQNAAYLGGNLFAHDFTLCSQYAHGLEAAQAVVDGKQPTASHLILGSRDQMTPARATTTLAKALRANISQLACGHSLMAEAPAGLSLAIARAVGLH